MVILLITYYIILFSFENNSNPNNEEFPDSSTEETPTNPFNIESDINLVAIYDKHSSTYLTNPQRQPADTSNNEQDEGLSSQEHQRRNYKQQSSLRSQHRRSPFQTFLFFSQTPSRTLPQVTSQVVAGFSRTQEPTSQNSAKTKNMTSLNEAEPKPPKELHNRRLGTRSKNQNVPGDSSSFEIADPVLAEETVAIHLQDITESTSNNDEIVEADLNNNNNFNINNFGDDNDINNNNENDDNDNNDNGNDDNNNDKVTMTMMTIIMNNNDNDGNKS
ncbi:hypothetical protein Glove_85g44 [Diversispora epigaea]|uniref:Uncharacterized protein n=1 Tax=Diversispora epigaea TaxID=1348612 RepID=A0A397JBE3_9GLOM|nr:hypothetical protein Glove_85g44 [Diversispora epigaea]